MSFFASKMSTETIKVSETCFQFLQYFYFDPKKCQKTADRFRITYDLLWQSTALRAEKCTRLHLNFFGKLWGFTVRSFKDKVETS